MLPRVLLSLEYFLDGGPSHELDVPSGPFNDRLRAWYKDPNAGTGVSRDPRVDGDPSFFFL